LEWVNHKIFFPAPHLISGKVKSMLCMAYTLQGQDCMCPYATKQKNKPKKPLRTYKRGQGGEGKKEVSFLAPLHKK
jgi:hypothetical protein